VRSFPTLYTKRLVLRAFEVVDAPAVQRLAGDRNIAATTMKIPHPYDLAMAEEWIATHEEGWSQGRSLSLAVERHSDNGLVGAIGLRIEPDHACAELGYWIGKPHWRRGFATEAAEATLAFGFNDLRLNRIHAHYFRGNTGSGRVLQKLGMKHEGCLRQHVKKGGAYEDVELYGIIASEWQTIHANGL
jgi:RimJ/RimL family protein N-acetyltransferase